MLIALALDKCQLELNCSLEIGTLSVWPSILRTQSIFLGILLDISFRLSAIFWSFWIPSFSIISEPESKKPKEKYLTGSNFQPYLTSGPNDLAYPRPPDSLKFQN